MLNGDEAREQMSWRLFSLLDFHWVQFVLALRRWNIPFENIVALRHNLSLSIDRDDPQATHQTVFAIVLAEFVITRMNVNVLITQDKQLFLHNLATQELVDPDFLTVLNQPHVSIPLTAGFTEQALVHGSRAERFELPGFLSVGEQALIAALRIDGVSQVDIVPIDLPLVTLQRDDFPSHTAMLRSCVNQFLGWPYEHIGWLDVAGNAYRYDFTAWPERLTG